VYEATLSDRLAEEQPTDYFTTGLPIYSFTPSSDFEIRPLTKPLYREFAKIQNSDDVIAFADRWGLLSGEITIKETISDFGYYQGEDKLFHPDLLPESPLKERFFPDKGHEVGEEMCWGERLNTWVETTRNMSLAIALYDIMNEDSSPLRRTQANKLLKHVRKEYDDGYKWVDGLPPDFDNLQSSLVLRVWINRHLKKYTSVKLSHSNSVGNFLTQIPDTLLGYMWLRLSLDICKAKLTSVKAKVCRMCGAPLAGRSDKECCSGKCRTAACRKGG